MTAERKRNILVTGSTDGIGLETARVLLSGGHRVIVHGRSEEKARAAAATLGHDVPFVAFELASLEAVRRVWSAHGPRQGESPPPPRR